MKRLTGLRWEGTCFRRFQRGKGLFRLVSAGFRVGRTGFGWFRVGRTGFGWFRIVPLLVTTRNHFDFIVIICPTLRYNSTYKNRSWVWNDPDVIPIEPDNQLYYLIEKISNLLAGSKTLFLIDDIIANETLDKHRQ